MKLSREIKTALLVIFGLGFFYFGFNFLKGSSVFSKQKVIYSVYDEVEGLSIGADVNINGLSIGKITKIDFLPGSTQILVSMRVRGDLAFSSASEAILYETGLIGGKAIMIQPIFENGKSIKTGDTLPSGVQPGFTELVNQQIAPLQQKLTSTLTSVDELFDGVSNVLNNQTQENLKTTLSELTRTVENANNITRKLNRLLDSNATALDTTFKHLASTSANLSQISDSLVEVDFKAILAQYNKIATNLNQVLDQVNTSQGTAGKLINDPALYTQLNATLEELESLLNDLKNNPKRYVHFSLFGKKNTPYTKEKDD
ncbi:MAG: MCE family protein [Flavobacteriia bacterium]|nr:MCE family protein [Flavobacteriia bacterium]